MNENFFIGSSFFCFDLFLSHSFSLLSWFWCSRPFQNNHMHCEIVDNYLTYFLLKCNWKKKTWKIFFGCPNWLISLPNSLNTSLVYIQTHQVFFIGKQFQSPPATARSPPLPLLSLLREQCSECLERLKELLPGLWYVRGWSTQADTK